MEEGVARCWWSSLEDGASCHRGPKSMRWFRATRGWVQWEQRLTEKRENGERW